MTVRKLTLTFLLSLFCLTSFGTGFNVNFSDMELNDFVSFVSEFTKKNIVYDRSMLKGKVSIDSQSQIRSADVLDIFASTLRANGFELVDRGKYYEIVRQSDYMDIDDSSGTEGENALITTVIYPKNFDSRILANVLNKLKSKGGYVEVMKGMNAVIIRDRLNRIVKIRNFIDKLDTRADSLTLRTVKVENASAVNVADRLVKLFAEMEKKNYIATDPVVVADEYSNMLLVAADEHDYEKLMYIIKQLDTKSPGSYNAPKVFYLKNASAEDVGKVLASLTGNISNPTDKKADNTKASVTYDKSTNSIIVFGDQDLYAKVESLVQKLDIQRKQVYVEALILETTLDSGNKFGVEWLAGAGSGSAAGTIGYVNDSGSLVDFQSSTLDGESPNFSALSGGFNLGVLGNIISYEGVNFPTLGLLANFVKTASGINILSNPQILTLDNEEAEVFVGENRPFLTSTKYDSNNQPVYSYDYKDVGVKLKIIPQISADDTITLKIEQEVKKVSESTTVATAPITLTRSTKTKVKLKDGSMMVISGLLKDDSTKSNSAVPGLANIPILGWLFKTKSGSYEKTNMMVFISTYIINTQQEADKLTEKKHSESVEFNKEIDEKIRKEFK
ncbi:MAG: type II secretion system secretin GspD [Deferribacterales bacterium]